MPAVCATVVDGTRKIVNSRALSEDKLSTLGSVLEVILQGMEDYHRFFRVQPASSDAARMPLLTTTLLFSWSLDAVSFSFTSVQNQNVPLDVRRHNIGTSMSFSMSMINTVI